MNSLTTLFGLAAQTAQGSAATSGYNFRALSVDSTPNFEEILNQNHMIGLHGRATAQASIPERSGFSVPLSVDFGLYPRSIGEALIGIGMIPTTVNKAAPFGHVYEHKFVKSDQEDARYVTAYVKMGSDPTFTRQISDTRLSRMEWTLNRQGALGSMAGLGLRETIIALPATIQPEANSMFLPFVGSMLWVDPPGGAGTAYDFGCVQEQVITWDRQIEEDDQCLHNYYRSDNQELSFALSGAARGISFSRAFYEHMIYADNVAAGPSKATLLTGLTMIWETGANIPGGTDPNQQPFKLMLHVPKASVLLTDFRAAGNDVIRANITWQMIDDSTSPPLEVQLENDVPQYLPPGSLAAPFQRAGGNTITDWNATIWANAAPALDALGVTITAGTVTAPPVMTIQARDQFGRDFPGYSGTVNLVLGNPSGATLTPTTATLSNGRWSGVVTINQAGTGYTITATDPGSGIAGSTGAFDITAGGSSDAFDSGFDSGFA